MLTCGAHRPGTARVLSYCFSRPLAALLPHWGLSIGTAGLWRWLHCRLFFLPGLSCFWLRWVGGFGGQGKQAPCTPSFSSGFLSFSSRSPVCSWRLLRVRSPCSKRKQANNHGTRLLLLLELASDEICPLAGGLQIKVSLPMLPGPFVSPAFSRVPARSKWASAK